MFIMLAGSSGAGKNTLINDLKPKNSSVVLMPTLTTRAMRAGEVEGNPFYYLTKEEFEDKVKAGELFEHELIHGNFYGSSKIIFNEYLKSGKILMKDIGVEGAINLSRILKPFTNTIRVFLTTKNKRVLVSRLKGRGEKDIKKRLKRYPYEQAQKYKFDFIILNKTIEQTNSLLLEIIKNENSFSNFVFLKPVSKLNIKKITKLCEKYKENAEKIFADVLLKDGKIILLNGEEKFVASLIVKVNLCKQVKKKKRYKKLTEEQNERWQIYIKNLQV
ncbi:MAG: hypothetical protein PHC46_02960 [Clostridia bacterium]|nr:hypothetical protein [Clostridia bacterium]